MTGQLNLVHTNEVGWIVGHVAVQTNSRKETQHFSGVPVVGNLKNIIFCVSYKYWLPELKSHTPGVLFTTNCGIQSATCGLTWPSASNRTLSNLWKIWLDGWWIVVTVTTFLSAAKLRKVCITWWASAASRPEVGSWKEKKEQYFSSLQNSKHHKNSRTEFHWPFMRHLHRWEEVASPWVTHRRCWLFFSLLPTNLLGKHLPFLHHMTNKIRSKMSPHSDIQKALCFLVYWLVSKHPVRSKASATVWHLLTFSLCGNFCDSRRSAVNWKYRVMKQAMSSTIETNIHPQAQSETQCLTFSVCLRVRLGKKMSSCIAYPIFLRCCLVIGSWLTVIVPL